MTAIRWGETLARKVATRLHKPVANTAAITAIPATDRTDGMLVLATGSSGLWQFAASSSASAASDVLVPDAGSGRWLLIAQGGTGGSEAIHAQAASEAAIKAIAAAGRFDGMIVMDETNDVLWAFDSGSGAAGSAWVLVPDAGTGRWLRRDASLADLSSTDPAKGAALIGYDGGTTVKAQLDANMAVVKRTCTITQAGDLAGLGAGVKTLSKNIGAATPANARLVGWSLGEGSFVAFDDATHGTYGLEVGEVGSDVDEIATSTDVKAGATGFPKTGTAGVLGFDMAPIASKQYGALLTSSVDLNTATAGSVVVNLFYLVLA